MSLIFIYKWYIINSAIHCIRINNYRFPHSLSNFACYIRILKLSEVLTEYLYDSLTFRWPNSWIYIINFDLFIVSITLRESVQNTVNHKVKFLSLNLLRPFPFL